MRDEDLHQIVVLAANAGNKRDIVDALGQLGQRNPIDSPSVAGFTQFLLGIHDYAVKADSGTRALIFRLVRHALGGPEHLPPIATTGFHLLIVAGLEKDHEFVLERMQALRIIREWIELDCTSISKVLVRSLAAIASHREDNCRRVCLETLRELCVKNPYVVAQTNGIRALFDAVLDSSTADMAEPILLSLLYILNDEQARAFIRPYLDWQYLLSPFSDLDEVEQQERQQRWQAAKTAFVIVMRSWVGVVQLASDPLGLPSLVRLLADPYISTATQKAIMEAFSEALAPVVTQGIDDNSSEEFSNNQVKAMWLPSAERETAASSTLDPVYNLLDSYAALLCCAFLHAGLIQCLCTLATSDDDSLASSARKLVVDLLLTIARLFPAQRCSQVLALPELIEYAASATALKYSNRALKASNVLAALAGAFSVNRYVEPASVEDEEEEEGHTAAKASASDLRTLSDVADELTQTSHSRLSSPAQSRTTRYDMMYELKLAMDAGLDRATFETQMQRSRVLNTKDCFRWDWSLISDMLEYSIRQPQRLSEALRTKWIKRISGFYRCSVEEKGFFAHLSWDPHNLHYLECACNMYNVLVDYEDGRGFLTADRRGQLFAEIVRELESLVQHAGNPTGPQIEHVLDPFACTQSMAREYFTLLGRLTGTDAGRDLMHSTHLFQHLSTLGQHKKLDYLSRLALTSLGFTDAGFISRNLLQVWTTSGGCSKELRLYAHSLLRALLRARVDEFEKWGIDVLVTQLQFDDLPTASLISILEEAAQDRRYLKALILKRPEIFNKPGIETLLVRFLALPEGLEYLQQLDWFEGALQRWLSTDMLAYTQRVEMALAKALNQSQVRQMQAQSLRPIPFNAHSVSALSRDPSRSSASAATGTVDLEGLLRAPWNMDVRLSLGGNVAIPDKTLTIDCYLDASDVGSPTSCEISSDATRLVVVRGIVLNRPGENTDNRVLAQHTIHTSLQFGACPVRRTGHLHSFRENDPWRRTHAPSTGNVRRGSIGGYEPRQSFVAESDDIHGVMQPLLVTESLKDWSICKAYHRQTRIPWESNSFAVEASGEPVRWIFVTGATGDIYLSEVQYVLQVRLNQLSSQTAQKAHIIMPSARVSCVACASLLLLFFGGAPLYTRPMFVAIPRHFMGELARTLKGCTILKSRNIIQELLAKVFDDALPSLQRRAALWALGHIGAQELGYQLLEEIDADCLAKIGRLAVNSRDFSMRGTAFSVLGLFSRTARAREILTTQGWDASPLRSTAVSVPADPAILFHRADPPAFEGSSAVFNGNPETIFQGIAPQLSAEEQEVLQAIAKLPGHILYKDTQQTLQRLRRTKPELFQSRRTYLAVQEVLMNYGFKLPLRKGINSMFSESAKCLSI